MSFNESLEAGKKTEEKVLAWVQKKYPESILIPGACRQADILVIGKEQIETIECKQDFKSEHTGNIVIEVSFGGKDSGIMVTRSTWWVIVDSKNMYFVTPIQILRCIAKHNFRLTEWQGPGDIKFKKAYLVPTHILLEYVSFIVNY